MRNTGKSSEGQFVASYEKAGAFVHRFFDAVEIYGRNGGRASNVPPQPADFLVTQNYTFLAEVKSTSNKHRFDFSLLRPHQHAAGIKTIRNHGPYFVYAHRLATDEWYRIPYEVIRDADKAGKKSLRWDELESFAWDLPQ